MVSRTSIAFLTGILLGLGLINLMGIPLGHRAAPFVLAIGIGLGAMAIAYLPKRRTR